MKARLRFDHSSGAWSHQNLGAMVAIAKVANISYSDGVARYESILSYQVAGNLEELRRHLQLEAALWDAALTAVYGAVIKPYTCLLYTSRCV